MATLAATPPTPHLLRRSWATNRPLTLVGTAMVAVLVLSIVGLIVDPRVITGAPAWLKPAKFAISITVYAFTLVWLLTYIQGHRRLVAAVSWITAGTLGLEMVLIGGAAAAGTTSHFNVSTPLHTAIWSTMGTAIAATWAACLVVGALLLRQTLPDRAFAWSLRFGVLLAAIGMAVAFFMTSPTPDQLATAQSGGGMTIAGAHAVGVADGGPGLPVVGWSTVGGDLRVPHFIGLHGLQVLPLIGLLVGRYAPARARVGLVVTAGLGYLGAVGLTTVQALRGEPLLAPSGTTVAGFVALAVAVAAGIATSSIRGRSAGLG